MACVEHGLRIELRAAFAGTNLINSWQDCAGIMDSFPRRRELF
jgi:hypothetical protein